MKQTAFVFLFFVFAISSLFAQNNTATVEINDTVIVKKQTTTITQGSIQEHKPQEQLPPVFSVIPFASLLLMLATGPLFFRHFWEKYYPIAAIGLGALVTLFYIFVMHDWHSMYHSLTEYISFIALLGSLFVASGGVMIKVHKKPTPIINVLFLLFGALIANVIGTTGASMLLIRPFMRMNQDRMKPYLVVFFIFIVSNLGGGLTPLGDPPLFLGFLRGVPFLWVTSKVLLVWLIGITLVLTAFYFFDKKNTTDDDPGRLYNNSIEFKGWRNIGFLAIIIGSVFLDPNIFDWVPVLPFVPFGIRELLMFAVMFFSFKFANNEIHKVNEFNFEPIKEVAILFIGIFLTMVPALQHISNFARVNSELFTTSTIYWISGSLSSVLDNAPTYLNFLSAAMGKVGLDVDSVADVKKFVELNSQPGTGIIDLIAISVATVFFGAVTYIGNGPNFMVKSIAEQRGIRMPNFLEYVYKYSLPVLIPIFVFLWLLFFNS